MQGWMDGWVDAWIDRCRDGWMDAHVCMVDAWMDAWMDAWKKELFIVIDPMHKWRQFKYSFVYIQISPTSLILGNVFF